MKSISDASYNERLFSGGLRGWLHRSRFLWLRDKLVRLGITYESVLELGCYDGKAIHYLPIQPRRYEGFDANVENGLALATDKWRNYPYRFHLCTSADEMTLSEPFDIALAMETLEHIADDLLNPYLEKISRHLNGYFFITVPNEKGFIFLAKWIAKTLLTKDTNQYSSRDIVNHTFNRIDRVEHLRSHKGFDYSKLVRQVGKHFEVVEVEGIQFTSIPSLSFGVGIVAKRRS